MVRFMCVCLGLDEDKPSATFGISLSSVSLLGLGWSGDCLLLGEVEWQQVCDVIVLRTLRQNWNRATAGRPRVRINAIGFFYESPDVGAFLWGLARENDGSFVGMSKP